VQLPLADEIQNEFSNTSGNTYLLKILNKYIRYHIVEGCPLISRNMLTVGELFMKPLCTSHERITRLSMQDLSDLSKHYL